VSTETIEAAHRITGAQLTGELPRWLDVHLSWSILTVACGNPNIWPGEIEERAVAPLRAMFPGGADRHEHGAALPGRTKRGTLDAWDYRVHLDDEAAATRYRPLLIVRYPRAHVDHEWTSRLPSWQVKEGERVELVHRCRWCGRRPSAKQARAAGLPALVWPEA